MSGDLETNNPTPSSVTRNSAALVKDFIKRELPASYIYSLVQLQSNKTFRTIWSKPTPSDPVANPVVIVHFYVEDDHTISFQIENQRFRYTSGAELDFERALQTVVQNKRVVASMFQ